MQKNIKQANWDVKRLKPDVRNVSATSVGGSKHPRTVGRDVHLVDKRSRNAMYKASDAEDRGLV